MLALLVEYVSYNEAGNLSKGTSMHLDHIQPTVDEMSLESL